MLWSMRTKGSAAELERRRRQAVALLNQGVKAAQAARAADMKADKQLMARIRLQAAEKDCKSWLSMARNYVNAGMPDKAGPYLKDILAKYPDTPFAEEARKLLAEIGQ